MSNIITVRVLDNGPGGRVRLPACTRSRPGHVLFFSFSVLFIFVFIFVFFVSYCYIVIYLHVLGGRGGGMGTDERHRLTKKEKRKSLTTSRTSRGVIAELALPLLQPSRKKTL